MDENNTENIVDNNVDTNVDTEVQTAVDTNVETKVETEKQEAPPKKEYEWNKKEPDPIPYNRFKEVNERAKEAERRAEELDRRIKEIEAANKKPDLPEIKSIDDISPENYKDADGNVDAYAWMRAREQYIQEQTLKEFEARINANKQREEAAKKEAEIVTSFNAKLQKSAEVDPEIINAANWFGDKYGAKLPPQIKYAIVTDENAPELIMHLCTEGSDIMTMMEQGAYIDAMREMAKWSAKYVRKAPATETKESNTETVDNSYEKQLEDRFTRRKAVPPQIKSSTTGTKDPSKMNKEEYREWRKTQGR